MKIVINDCRGEFSLSEEAVKEYAIRRNLILYMKRIPTECIYFTKAKELRRDAYDGIWEPKRHIPRFDTVLVDIVEKMGRKANTIYSRLVVKEVDEDSNWSIVENDGKEQLIYD